ncbi:hypothetical protein [Spirosoma areae]
MTSARIRLGFRQVIDAGNAQTSFERDVFADSFNEFRLQIQTYNPDNQFTTWQQVREAVPQSNPTLPVNVGFAVGLYVRELNGQMPGLTDTFGQPVAFTEHRFDLLDSDITDRTKHRVALTYLTDTLTLVGTVGSYLLLAFPSQPETTDSQPPVLETFVIEMQPNLSIVSYLPGTRIGPPPTNT